MGFNAKLTAKDHLRWKNRAKNVIFSKKGGTKRIMAKRPPRTQLDFVSTKGIPLVCTKDHLFPLEICIRNRHFGHCQTGFLGSPGKKVVFLAFLGILVVFGVFQWSLGVMSIGIDFSQFALKFALDQCSNWVQKRPNLAFLFSIFFDSR